MRCGLTVEEIRRLDAWVRQVTGAHPDLALPRRVTVSPFDPLGDLVVQVDPVEAERRGHGPRSDEVMRIPVRMSEAQAREAITGRMNGFETE